MMNRFCGLRKLLFVLGILNGSSAIWADDVKQAAAIELTDFQVYPINGIDQIEPSGLTLKEGVLFTVGDKHRAIYRLDIINHEAWLTKALNLNSEQDLGVTALDLEGITTVNGEFILVSESHHRLIHVDDGQLRWLPERGNDLYQSAFDAGLLQLHNAGLEAVTYLGGHRFLVAAERQPRGLIEIQFDRDLKVIQSQLNQLMPNSRQHLHGRHPDLTGLFVHHNQVFGLQRNAYVIHELNRSGQGDYSEGQAWSYEHIVRDSRFAYSDMQYGHAEGLAVDDDFFYLVLDNNRMANAKNPNDKRPLLIIAKRPVLYRRD